MVVCIVVSETDMLAFFVPIVWVPLKLSLSWSHFVFNLLLLHHVTHQVGILNQSAFFVLGLRFDWLTIFTNSHDLRVLIIVHEMHVVYVTNNEAHRRLFSQALIVALQKLSQRSEKFVTLFQMQHITVLLFYLTRFFWQHYFVESKRIVSQSNRLFYHLLCVETSLRDYVYRDLEGGRLINLTLFEIQKTSYERYRIEICR